MQIIKDSQITDDAWHFISDESQIQEGEITVSSNRLVTDADALINRKGKLGVRIVPEDSVAEIAPHLSNLVLVELHFPELADGRLFSHAWLLRNRYHYLGEIRATGHFLPDQVFYLSRVGVNSFQPENSEMLMSTLEGLKDFSVKYQPSVN